MKYYFYFLGLVLSLVGCKPEDRTKGIVCDVSKEELKPILNDIFVYEATRSTKALDSLTQTFHKEAVYRAIYKKHGTNREKLQKDIKCLTDTKQLIPILDELELSFKNWRENPEFDVYESADTIQ